MAIRSVAEAEAATRMRDRAACSQPGRYRPPQRHPDRGSIQQLIGVAIMPISQILQRDLLMQAGIRVMQGIGMGS